MSQSEYLYRSYYFLLVYQIDKGCLHISNFQAHTDTSPPPPSSSSPPDSASRMLMEDIMEPPAGLQFSAVVQSPEKGGGSGGYGYQLLSARWIGSLLIYYDDWMNVQFFFLKIEVIQLWNVALAFGYLYSFFIHLYSTLNNILKVNLLNIFSYLPEKETREAWKQRWEAQDWGVDIILALNRTGPGLR